MNSETGGGQQMDWDRKREEGFSSRRKGSTSRTAPVLPSAVPTRSTFRRSAWRTSRTIPSLIPKATSWQFTGALRTQTSKALTTKERSHRRGSLPAGRMASEEGRARSLWTQIRILGSRLAMHTGKTSRNTPGSACLRKAQDNQGARSRFFQRTPMLRKLQGHSKRMIQPQILWDSEIL